MANKLDLLAHYVELGWSIIPIRQNSKTALIEWKPYQTKPATKEQVIDWFHRFKNCNWAVITGKVSNLFIVDFDNPAAKQAAEELGIVNGCSVTTPNGGHCYFKYKDDGKERKTISGAASKGTYWPQILGLDARSDGGYALLPPSSGYEWDIEEEIIQDELTEYEDWKGATFEEQQPTPTQPQPQSVASNKFEGVDLTNTALPSGSKQYNKTHAKWAELAKQHPSGKVPRGGSGIHDATYNFMAEEALIVGLGPELEAAGRKFMDDYFESPLTDGRFETSLTTVRQKERENHPERFDANGNYIYHLSQKGVAPIPSVTQPLPQVQRVRTITTSEAAEFNDSKVECWQYPWLPKASIVQVYGYSGHGKSMFLQHALHFAGLNLHFGPFERDTQTPKILYMDFENGRATLGRRTHSMKSSFGDPKENLIYWTPWLEDDYINLREPEGVTKLLYMLNDIQPDILVIDTLRSAYPGLEENSAQEWASINQLSLKIRNAGCTVILVHHSNKPSDGTLGREAGSSNQLTTLETQLRVTQVYEDAQIAKTKGGIFNGEVDFNPFYEFRQQVRNKGVIQMVFELSYGKVREWTDLHDAKQYIGIAVMKDGDKRICFSDGPKERLRKMIVNGRSLQLILNTLGRPIHVLKEWAEDLKLDLPPK